MNVSNFVPSQNPSETIVIKKLKKKKSPQLGGEHRKQTNKQKQLEYRLTSGH